MGLRSILILGRVLKNINTELIMEKEYKIGIVMQPSETGGNASGKRGVVGRFVITNSDGEDIEVEITDQQDDLAVEALMPRVKSGDIDALRELAPIIEKYDPIAAAMLLFRTGDNGEAWIIAGDYWDEVGQDVDAFKAYTASSKYGHPCGKCKLGCYYAQGIGCKKNKALAKKWLEEATQECPDAEKYLDQYGLR